MAQSKSLRGGRMNTVFPLLVVISTCFHIVFLSDDPLNNRQVLDDTVVIHKAGAKESGVFQCEASNHHGSILANINVLIMSE